MKNLLLSFDIEEFDFPLEYGAPLSEKEQCKISYEGLLKILRLLDKLNIKTTFFVTYNFAKYHKNLMEKMSLKHEIGLHGYSHDDNYNKMTNSEVYSRLKEAKLGIEKIIKKKIVGFRAPKLQDIDKNILLKLEFKYDSSLNPTFIPGRYNNFFSKRKTFVEGGIKIIPSSVVPIVRFPLFWLTFRNFGGFLNLILSKLCLIGTGYINLYFHPWEFVNLRKMKIPYLIKRNTGDKLIKKLEKFIIKGKFKVNRFDEFLEKIDRV